MSIFSKVWNWFVGVAKAAWEIVAPAVKQAAVDFVNDPKLQRAAHEAVYAAARQGLTGDKAWVTARDTLVAQLKAAGIQAAANWIDTILQNAYFAFANNDEK